MKIDLLLHSATQVLTLPGGPQRGRRLGTLGLIPGGAVAIDRGEILEVGPSDVLQGRFRPAQDLDCRGRVLLPGFVDCHTHAVWVGDRAAEFEMRLQGRSYLEILAGGGGIMSTVRATRGASLDQLVGESRTRIERMLAHGSTTIEVKTGYGLDVAVELRMLEAILRLDEAGPPRLIPTFLAAHAVPDEFQGRTDEYVALVADTMLPELRRWWAERAPGRPLPFVDVFCEEGVFSLAHTRRILEAAQGLDFPLKIHADEFVTLGGARLAAELEAVSADHLLATPDEEIRRLARSPVVAVFLPATPFGLHLDARPPVEAFLEEDGLLAIGSDLNPGTAWCESMQFTLGLACRSLGLSPAQAIAAATINGAAALGLEDRVGSLEPGKRADVIVLDAPDYRHLGYRFGTNLVSRVIQGGQLVI